MASIDYPVRMSEPLFETGPIRPPSEAASLLVRVTRNCPWNRCSFCPVYKGRRFSLRDASEVKTDIDAMAEMAQRAGESLARWERHEITRAELVRRLNDEEPRGASQIVLFLQAGAQSAFLQDANSLIVPVDALVDVVEHLRERFPTLARITTYARSHTVIGRSVEDLRRLSEAGLNRVHIGLESGSDRVLARVQKGVTAARHIEAGKRVKAAGIELSEYVMPGLGGRDLSREHARETARVLTEIDPDFVRLRSLTIAPGSPLDDAYARGDFEPLGQVEVVREIRQLLQGMTGMTGRVHSDHILNLLDEIDGRLPDDLSAMLDAIDRFLALPVEDREAFTVGRRLGWLRRLDDLAHPVLRARCVAALGELKRQFPGDLDRAMLQLTRGMV
jgi:hypothetical protein